MTSHLDEIAVDQYERYGPRYQLEVARKNVFGPPDEIHDYIPAGRWQGKMPTKAVPLTDTWIKAQVRSGSITPPLGWVPRTERVGRIVWGIFGVLVILLLGLAFTYNLWGKS